MNLDKVPDVDKLELCRKYYIGGFFLLPFLWFINFIWFFKEAFIRPPFEEQKQMKKYLIKSCIGSVIWTAALVAWITLFQLNRARWGATSDAISFIIPQGIP
ncbi:gamma-secretase subunit PEN-2-like [Acanthaster planci]|uniref:Gamma-secretase subunit PEN-2 n=1 Tax=Acanthaster planci TaxID=133434 RepID=A0A8B7ZVH2_ACAPL|nr:gamma-secretase subunit PEN-2-like [Acanthaster planci]